MKNATKKPGHTPGPWTVSDRNQPEHRRLITSDHGSIVLGEVYDDNKVGTSVDATARLIAATPELLEAVRWMRDYTRSCDMVPDTDSVVNWDVWNEYLAAIAKAEGK